MSSSPQSQPIRKSSEAPDIRIQAYRESNYDGLAEMYAAYGPTCRTLGTPPGDDDRRDAWLDDLLDVGGNWIARTDSRVLGHVTLIPIDDERSELSVYVHPDAFDQGIGTALTRQAVAHGCADNDRLWLAVERANTRAVRVFRKAGFDVIADHGHDVEMELCCDGQA